MAARAAEGRNVLEIQDKQPLCDGFEYYIPFPGMYQKQMTRMPESAEEIAAEFRRSLEFALKAAKEVKGQGSRREKARLAAKAARLEKAVARAADYYADAVAGKMTLAY